MPVELWRAASVAASLCVATSATLAGPIGIGDFASPVIQGFGNPSPTALASQPLSIGPVTFTSTSSTSLQWWAANNVHLDCIGGCVANNSSGVGNLIVTLDGEYDLAGLYVGQATAFSLTVSFFDASSNLLGSVAASGPGDGVAFAGWEDTQFGVKRIVISNSASNGFVVAAQSGYFQREAVTSVPEPSTSAVALLALALLGASRASRPR